MYIYIYIYTYTHTYLYITPCPTSSQNGPNIRSDHNPPETRAAPRCSEMAGEIKQDTQDETHLLQCLMADPCYTELLMERLILLNQIFLCQFACRPTHQQQRATKFQRCTKFIDASGCAGLTLFHEGVFGRLELIAKIPHCRFQQAIIAQSLF